MYVARVVIIVIAKQIWSELSDTLSSKISSVYIFAVTAN